MDGDLFLRIMLVDPISSSLVGLTRLRTRRLALSRTFLVRITKHCSVFALTVTKTKRYVYVFCCSHRWLTRRFAVLQWTVLWRDGFCAFRSIRNGKYVALAREISEEDVQLIGVNHEVYEWHLIREENTDDYQYVSSDHIVSWL